MNSFRLLSLAPVFAGLVFVSSALSQNVSVVSGNGQVLGGTHQFLQPLVVQVTNATTGAPFAGAVNWQSSSNGVGFNGSFRAADPSTPNRVTLGTDSIGQSTAFMQFSLNPLTLGPYPFIQTTVTATVAGTSNAATFTVTQLAQAPKFSNVPSVLIVQTNVPDRGSTLPTGAIGTTSSPIQLQVNGQNGQSLHPIPNAAVQLLNFEDPAKGPLVACASTASSGAGLNTALSDANGIVTCTPVFGGQPGQGQFLITVGGVQSANSSPAGFWQPLNDDGSLPLPQTAYVTFPPTVRINATPGTPGAAGSIKIISPSGGTQTVTAGTSESLIVEVDNAAGLPTSGSTVNWKVVSPATGATLAATTTTSDSNGRASNTLSLSSSVSGVVQVTATLASDATKSVTFTINVSTPVTITQFQIVSGNNQSAQVNTGFGQPLVVQVTTSAGAGANIPVQFSVASGSISLSSGNVSTDSTGKAQVTVSAGSVTGLASVLATVASNSGIGAVTFQLTVTSVPVQPAITAANFVNGADFQRNSLSPCSIGALVANAGTLGVQSVLPLFPGGSVSSSTVQLTFGNIGAPILSIGDNAAGQQLILFQVPCEVTPGSAVPASLSVGGTLTNVNLAVQAASPGVFQTQMSDGVLRAVLVRPDGSFVSLTNPARQGEIVVAYVTGLGPTTPGVSTHSLPAPSSTETTAADATVQGIVIPGMSGGGAQLVYARLSEDLPGIYVVAFQIPSDAATGNDIGFSIGVIPPGSSTAFYSGLSKIPVSAVH